MASQTLAVYLLGYSQSIGTAEIQIKDDSSVCGHFFVELEDISAELKFKKTIKQESIIGKLNYNGVKHDIFIEDADMISLKPSLIIAGFFLNDSNLKFPYFSRIPEPQSLYQNSSLVLNKILKKDDDIERLVDMVILYLKTGIYQWQK